MIAPTPRAAGLFALGVPLTLVVVAVDPSKAWLVVGSAFLVLAAAGIDALLALPPWALDTAVTPPERLFLGATWQVTVEIAAPRDGRRTMLMLLLEQRGDLDPPAPERVVLEPGRPMWVALPLRARRRGRAHVDALWQRWSGPLGLVRFVRRLPVGASIDVVPNLRGSGSAALRIAAEAALHGLKTQTQRGEGTEFTALREFTLGDDPRQVDWKHSARHRKLLAKEFQTERNHPVVLAYDTGRLGTVGIHRDAMTAAPRWIMAAKLSSVLSLRMAIRLNSFSLQNKFSIR